MGMFDYLFVYGNAAKIIQQKYPELACIDFSKEEFQTKDLGCTLTSFCIDVDEKNNIKLFKRIMPKPEFFMPYTEEKRFEMLECKAEAQRKIDNKEDIDWVEWRWTIMDDKEFLGEYRSEGYHEGNMILEPVEMHGYLNFYSEIFIGEDGFWFDFKAKFTDDVMVDLKIEKRPTLRKKSESDLL